ncbi:MAG: 4-hydroxy-tetrahydrodipicolinate synthase [Defluviitaleaceae bacterium]|nr:4-hydroxy-tetrahydrodipicolinate synthase [Defluviitaleaceae bacterium]
MAVFKGSAVAIATPFKKDKSIDFDAFKRLINFHLENETDAIVVCGTTGEGSTVSLEERVSLVSFAVAEVNGKIPIIAGAGSNNTAHAIELSRVLERAGANALLHVTPYYNKTSQRGLVNHFEMVAKSTNLPIILYSVPSRTGGLTIMPKTVYELAKIDNIVGVKEASSNIEQIAEIAALCRDNDNFDIYAGNDNEVVPIMSLGAKGVISTVANIVPKQMHDIVIKYLDGDFKESLKIQLDIHYLVKAVFSDVNPIPIKKALELMGLCDGVLREPLYEIDETNLEVLKTQLKFHKLI